MTESAPLLTVRDLAVDYRGRGAVTHAVRGVDFSVGTGEIVAVVGESGSGKSTISQALVRSLPEGGSIVGGSIDFLGRDLTRMHERSMRAIRGAEIGFVPQDPNNSLNPLLRVGEQIAETLRLHRRLDRRAAAEEAVRILAETGISDAATRAQQFPHELSGGMKQRVLIGIAWACGPRLVIADEPTSALDVTVQKQVLDRIGLLAREGNTSVVLVTHDLAVAADRADRIIVMSQGRIVEQGAAGDVLGNPQHDYTRELLAAAPGLSSARLSPRPVPVSSDLTIGFTRTESVGTAPILEVQSLGKAFSVRGRGPGSGITAAADVSFAVERGTTFSIVGESGSGKTTTARMAARIITPDDGRILVDGEDVTNLSGPALRRLRRRVQVVYQNPFASLDPTMTVEGIIAEPMRAFRVGTAAQRSSAVRALLDAVRLPIEFAKRRPVQLSGGQRQRVAIARSLALGPELVVLDEPVSALDVSVQEQILQLLVDLQSEFGLSYLFISHDLGVVRQISDSIAVMRGGRIIEQGPAERILRSPENDYTRALLTAIPGSGTAAR